MQNSGNGNAAPGPDLTPPDGSAIEPTPAEKLAGELAGVFDKAGELGADLDRGLLVISDYAVSMADWCRTRDPDLLGRLEVARTIGDHRAMLDAAHEIAEGAKSRAGASAKVWEVIAPLLKTVFLGVLTNRI